MYQNFRVISGDNLNSYYSVNLSLYCNQRTLFLSMYVFKKYSFNSSFKYKNVIFNSKKNNILLRIRNRNPIEYLTPL